jgi:hypothetical protein
MSLQVPPHLLEKLIQDGSVDLAGETLIVKDGTGNQVTIKIAEGTLDCNETDTE